MWYRCFPLLLVAGGLVVLTGAFSDRTASRASSATDAPDAPAVPATPFASFPEARTTAILDQALAAASPARVRWVEAGIWQKVQLPGFAYEATGHYLLAPGHRFRLEVQTNVGLVQGTLLTVSDGTDLWQATRTGPKDWDAVTRLGLREVFATLDGPSGSPRLRAEFMQGPTFSGVMPLLSSLRERLNWVGHKIMGHEGAERVQLVGLWLPEIAAALASPGQPWPSGLPRQCRLRLDARTLWPERIEWWGPSTPGGPETLLAQMELREPILNRELPAERCRSAFAFDPGNTPISDQTGTVTTGLLARARQLAAVEKH